MYGTAKGVTHDPRIDNIEKINMKIKRILENLDENERRMSHEEANGEYQFNKLNYNGAFESPALSQSKKMGNVSKRDYLLR